MDRVIVAEIAEVARHRAAQASLHEVVRWLGRHGIEATPRLSLSDGQDGGRMLDLAEGNGVDLIVAGAYGHSPLRELALGGVTHDLLRHGRCCMLMSH